MYIAKILIIVILSTVLCESLAQVKDKAGTSGFQFLKIGVGARETALGEAAISIVEGPSSIFWNTAGLTNNSGQTSVLFFHNSWIATIRHSFIALDIPIEENHAIGIALTLLNMDDMEETTIENPQGTGRRFGAGDFAISLSYAQMISDRLSAGLTVKYVNEYIWDLVTDGWAFDVGLQYKIGNFSLGMAFKDFGTNKQITGSLLESNQNIYEDWSTSPALVSLVPKEIRLPMSFNFGVGYEFLVENDHSFQTVANIAYFNDIGEIQNMGLEYTFLDAYSLRCGYHFNRDSFSVTGGVGLKTSVGPMGLQLDFAAVQIKDLNYHTQINIIISF